MAKKGLSDIFKDTEALSYDDSCNAAILFLHILICSIQISANGTF